jgi:hypothetical protein
LALIDDQRARNPYAAEPDRSKRQEAPLLARQFSKISGLTAIGLSLASLSSLMLAARAQESPQDVIAAHVRLQGFQCDAPKSATREARASRPDAQVWTIVCKNARYRVRLVPDMADIIEPF